MVLARLSSHNSYSFIIYTAIPSMCLDGLVGSTSYYSEKCDSQDSVQTVLRPGTIRNGIEYSVPFRVVPDFNIIIREPLKKMTVISPPTCTRFSQRVETPRATVMAERIPIVDFELLRQQKGDWDKESSLLEVLHEALSTVGFVYLSNHGISEELVGGAIGDGERREIVCAFVCVCDYMVDD